MSRNRVVSHDRYAKVMTRKTRDGKQRFAVPDRDFGTCLFLNDVSIEELQSVLQVHKTFVESRYGSGDGQEAYVDAGDLGADPETYVKTNGHDAKSLKRNGINGHDVKRAAVAAGGVPVDGTGVVTNGVRVMNDHICLLELR